jgi:hypothetical protein
LALRTGKVKRVLWEMSFDGYTLGINHFRDDLTPQTWLAVVSRPNVQKRLLFRRAVYHLTDVYKNFQIYDFALWKEVTTDPTLYKDFTHYHQDINRRMADIMSTGQPFRATNGTEANEQLLDISKRFDWKSIQCYPAR